MSGHGITRFDTPLAIPSPYYLGENIAAAFPAVLAEHSFDRCFLITSERLLPLFGRQLLAELHKSGIRCDVILVGEGEAHKSWSALTNLCEDLIARGATRDSVLIALGGGAVGNLVGLASGLIFRGIRFVEVPTTLMAQTDSTLSNKQAINGREGKNHFGLYHAPLFIWSDAEYPKSEPSRQRRAGVVEGIKNILITPGPLDRADSILDCWNDPARTRELAHRLIQSKLPILQADPTEKHHAVILEYGHTFGHAIEFLSKGKLNHGESVSIGMCLAARLSHRLGYMPDDLLRAHHEILGHRLGAPTQLPKDLAPEAIYQTMLADNKRTRRGLAFLLLRTAGDFVTENDAPFTQVDPATVMRILTTSN